MIVLGLLILGGASSVCGLLIASNLSTAPSYTPHVLGHTLPTVTAVDIFAAGIGLALLVCLGVWIIAAGLIERHRRAVGDTPVDEFLPGSWRIS